MKTGLIISLLMTAILAHAETDEVTTVLCRNILKAPRPRGISIEDCYNQAKTILKPDAKNPGSLERYIELAGSNKTVNKQCVDFFKDVGVETKKAGLRDEVLFPDASTKQGESRATLDEANYFYGECVALDTKNKETIKPATDGASAPAAHAK